MRSLALCIAFFASFLASCNSDGSAHGRTSAFEGNDPETTRSLLSTSARVDLVENLNDGFVAFEELRYSWYPANRTLVALRRFDAAWRMFTGDDPESFIEIRKELKLTQAQSEELARLLGNMPLRRISICQNGYLAIDGGAAGRSLSFVPVDGTPHSIGVNDNPCARSSHEAVGLVTRERFSKPAFEKVAEWLPPPPRDRTLFACRSFEALACQENPVEILGSWRQTERLPPGIVRAIAGQGCGADLGAQFEVVSNGGGMTVARWRGGTVTIRIAASTFSCTRNSP